MHKLGACFRILDKPGYEILHMRNELIDQDCSVVVRIAPIEYNRLRKCLHIARETVAMNIRSVAGMLLGTLLLLAVCLGVRAAEADCDAAKVTCHKTECAGVPEGAYLRCMTKCNKDNKCDSSFQEKDAPSQRKKENTSTPGTEAAPGPRTAPCDTVKKECVDDCGEKLNVTSELFPNCTGFCEQCEKECNAGNTCTPNPYLTK